MNNTINNGSNKTSSLSTAQKRIWFDCQNGEPARNHLALVYELSGDFSAILMQQALSQLVAENDIFRTTIFSANKNLERIVHETIKTDLKSIQLDETMGSQEVYQIINSLIEKPFNLSSGPLFRFTILRKNTEKNYLVLIFHRMIANTCSLKKIVTEISCFYADGYHEKLSHLKAFIPYSELVSHEKNYREQSHYRDTIQHWSNRIKDKRFHLDLSKLPETDENIALHRSEHFVLNDTMLTNIKAFNERFSCNTETLLLSTLQALLQRYSDQADIVINRHEEIYYQENWCKILGPTGNMTPWNVRLDKNTHFLGLIEKNKQFDQYKKRYPYGHLSDLVRVVRMKFNNYFDGFFSNVSFDQEYLPYHELQLPNVFSKLMRPYIHRVEDEDLRFFYEEHRGKIHLTFDYSSEVSVNAIRQFTTHYQQLLQELLNDPLQPISQVNFLSPEMKQQLIGSKVDLNPTYPSIVECFETSVLKYPENIALIDEHTQLTYIELNQRANQLARCIQEKFKMSQGRELKADDCIGLAVGRNVQMVIATLGILKSGASYVPLDPNYPQDRIAFMMQDADISLVITEQDIEPFIQSSHSVTAILLDKNLEHFENFSHINLSKKPALHDLAYIIYTSGSTGKPKGVLVEHRGIPNLAFFQNEFFPINEKTRCLQASSINFDITVFEVYGPLIAGATIFIANNDQRRVPQKLQDFIIEKNIEVILITPSVLSHFEWKAMPSLKVIMSGAEACEQKVMDYWAYGRTFINGYGPTEITVGSHFKKYQSNVAFNNLGTTIPHVNGLLLDSNFNLAPYGVAGELYIGGVGVARAYLNLPEQTAEKFIQNPLSNELNDIIYRTNDIAYRLESGDFMYMGRNDAQVKIRGLRVELGEIEEKIKVYPDIERVLVRVISHESLGKLLVAYYVQNALKKPIEEETLRHYLQSVLPEHMVPTYLIQVAHFPIMRNGKIDYQALPSPFSTTNHFEHKDCGEIENYLLSVFAELFRTEQKALSLDHDFFALGGHSLLATQMIARIKQHLKLNLPVNKVFELRTIKQLAEYLSTLKEESNHVLMLKHLPEKTAIPLSYSQKRLWFFYQLDKNSPLYNIPSLMHFKKGKIEFLKKAFLYLVEQNPTLRTVFSETEDDPIQKILPSVSFEIPIYQSVETFYQDIHLLDSKPFDLIQGPLFRLALAQDGDEVLLYFNVHHIIFDGWSLKILMHQLAKIYAALENKLPLPNFSMDVNYSDYCYSQHQWVQEEQLGHELEFWQHFLQDVTSSLDLPTDFPYPKKQNYQGNIVKITIPTDLTMHLKSFALENRTTLFSVLLTAYFVLLYRYSKQEDIVIATPIASRHQATLENIMGLFINASIYRQKLSNTKSFSELLQSIHQNACDAADNQILPFDTLLDTLNIAFDAKQSALFQVMFSLQTGHQLSGYLENTDVKYYVDERHTGTAKTDLCLLLNEMSDGILEGFVEYRTDLFTETSIQHLCTHYTNLLQAIISNPSTPIGELSILSYEEYQLLVNTWPYSEKATLPKKSVIEMIAETVELYPNNPALVYQNTVLTYLDFWKKVDELFSLITQTITYPFLQKNSLNIIGIFMPRGTEMIIAMCAIWKTGAAFLPLDPDYPEERLHYMLEDSNVKTIISISTLKEKQFLLKKLNDIIIIQADKNVTTPHITKQLSFRQSLQDPAYIIYTSGSTGHPKGVVLEHGGLSNLIVSLKELYELRENMRVLQLLSINFDASIGEIFPTLISGACLYITDNETRTSIVDLQNYIEKQKIQLFSISPAIFEQFEKRKMPELETVVVGGDVCETNTIDYWKKECRFINVYGPTEATVTTTSKIFNETEHSIIQSIGRPLDNTSVFILDDDLNPVPTGVIGEMFIGGAGLARGYLRREDLTLERFILHPFSDDPDARLYKTGDYGRWLSNGELDFIGRMDNQVKIRGFRIEMGEIESLLNAYPGMKQAVVIAKKVQQCLIAFFSAMSTIEISALREYLLKHLPEYMIPSHFFQMESLPINLSGKIDRKTLQKQDIQMTTVVKKLIAPRNDLEQKIANIWKEVLNIEHISVTLTFFELGGHSLLAAKASSRLKSRYGIHCSIPVIFQYKTIAAIAEYLQNEHSVSTLSNAQMMLNDVANAIEILEAIHKINLLESKISSAPEHILITGGHGFLGAHLLETLLKETKAVITCLVRADTLENLHQKVKKDLTRFNLVQLADNPRIQWIKGDLSLPKLGLDETKYNLLAEKIDSIYHSGAWINHVLEYQNLRITNVKSTIELLKLASLHHAKAIHYISTTSVDAIPVHPKEHSKAKTSDLNNQPGYIQSKWVSEAILFEAEKLGFDIRIFRAGNITGHSKTGICVAENNHALSLIKSCIQLGITPALGMFIEMIPVDLLSQIIVQWSLHVNPKQRLFDCRNKHSLAWDDCMHYLNELGFNIKKVTWNEWQNALEHLDENNALFPFKDFYFGQEEKKPPKDLTDSLVNSETQLIQEKDILGEIDLAYPSDYKQLITLYWTYLKKSGFVE